MRAYVLCILLVLSPAGCSNAEDEPGTQKGPDTAATGMTDGRDMMDDGGMMDGGGMMGEGMMSEGTMPDSMPRWMMSEGGMGAMMQDMRVIHSLLRRHERIERKVEDIPGGVRTITTSEDPETARMIRKDVRQMKRWMEAGRAIRQMDPLFRQLFEHRAEIEIDYEDIPGGIRVTETSENPEVVSLIRQHAHAFVSEVVEHGMQRAMRPTPLPDDYQR